MKKQKNLSKSEIHFRWFHDTSLNHEDFKKSKIKNVRFCYCDLSHVHFNGATLKNVVFRYCDLSNANFHGATLKNVKLKNCTLTFADFRGTDVDERLKRDLYEYCLVFDAFGIPKVDEGFFPMVCPEKGEFIGYKKIEDDKIVKLLIPEDAKRSSAFSEKCRCDKAVVLGIFDLNGDRLSNKTVGHSLYDHSFCYRVGEIVRADRFDDNRYRECTNGIHFFMDWEDAADFCL